MSKVHKGADALKGDGRVKLRAHWPPRRVNTVTIQLSADLYTRAYLRAEREGVSLNQAIRRMLEAGVCT